MHPLQILAQYTTEKLPAQNATEQLFAKLLDAKHLVVSLQVCADLPSKVHLHMAGMVEGAVKPCSFTHTHQRR